METTGEVAGEQSGKVGYGKKSSGKKDAGKESSGSSEQPGKDELQL